MPDKSRITKKARQLAPGVLHDQVPLAGLTSWKIGGPAERFFIPKDEVDFIKLVQRFGTTCPITLIGLGSNILVSSAGIAGITVLMTQTMNAISWVEPTLLSVQAGVSCSKIAKYSKSDALSFFAGIPGTIGGALKMNAGAFGGQTWDVIEKVEWVSLTGEKKILTPHDVKVAYRSVSIGEPGYFVRAFIRVPVVNKQAESIRELLRKRSNMQPIGLPSCGSVFKNPTGYHAAQLIEACGLKGMKVGDAEVSRKHANFIINLGHATSSDVLCLMEMIIQCVWLRFNVRLEPEVCLIGDFKEEEWTLLKSVA